MSQYRWSVSAVSSCIGVFMAGLSSGCAHENLPNSPVPHPPAFAASLKRVERPQLFLSQWDAENWQARESAFAAAGLVEVKLQPLLSKQAPRADIPVSTWCHSLTVSGQLLFLSRGGDFGLAPDGKLYCLKIELPSLGDKSVSIEGPPPNCGGGMYKQYEHYSSYFVVPDGVTLGGMKTLSVPFYRVAHQYKERCIPIP